VAHLQECIQQRRRERFRLVSVLYREAEGAPLLDVPLDRLREASGLEPKTFRLALLSLEGVRMVSVYDASDRLFGRRSWHQATGTGADAGADQVAPDQGDADFQIHLSESGLLLFEYMALNPTKETEIGVFNEAFDATVFEARSPRAPLDASGTAGDTACD
jgi:hypothetical protein